MVSRLRRPILLACLLAIAVGTRSPDSVYADGPRYQCSGYASGSLYTYDPDSEISNKNWAWGPYTMYHQDCVNAGRGFFLAIAREQCYNAGFFNQGEGFVRGHWFYDWWDGNGNGPTEEFFYPQYDCGDAWG